MLEMRSNFYGIVSHFVYIICNYKNTKKNYTIAVRIFSLTSSVLKQGLIPDYANINVSNTSPVAKVHQNKGAENMQNFKFAKEFKMNTRRMGLSSLFVRVYISNTSNRFRLNFVLGIQILKWILFCPVL